MASKFEELSPQLYAQQAIASFDEESFAPVIGWRRRKKEAGQTCEDEFNNIDIPTIKILKSVNVQFPYREKPDNYDNQLQREFDYYSKTRNLETNTERTQILQNIADSMTAKRDIETRVVIMNKGESPEAFVYPDGTIFISQSLLNLLDLDETAAVLAHEIKHLIQKTFEKKILAEKSLDKLGIGSIHEAVADVLSTDLLEEAGYNSMAAGSLAQKVSGNSRGIIHQSGDARGSEVVAKHAAIHSRTSSKPRTVQPEILTKEARKTNLEEAFDTINDLSRKEVIKSLEEIAPLLHPSDLEALYYSSYYSREEEVYRIYNELIEIRLSKMGYSPAEAKLFIVSLGEHECKDLGLILNPEINIEIANEMDDFEANGQRKRKDMYDKIFESGGKYKHNLPPTYRYMSYLSSNLYDKDVFPDEKGVPVTRDTLLETLSIISHRDLPRSSIESENTYILLRYIEQTYLAMADQEEVDPGQIRDFLEEAKEKGIFVSLHSIEGYGNSGNPRVIHMTNNHIDASPVNQNIVREAFVEIFEEPEMPVREFSFEDIDAFFAIYNGSSRYTDVKTKAFSNFKTSLEYAFGDGEEEDKRRLRFLTYIDSKIDSATYKAGFSLMKRLGKIDEDLELDSDFKLIFPPLTPEVEDQNDQIIKFNLKLLMSLFAFRKDTPAFYDRITDVMQKSGLDPKELTWLQLINLSHPLLILDRPYLYKHGQYYGENKISSTEVNLEVSDFEKLFSLPFLSEALGRSDTRKIKSIKVLDKYAAEQILGIYDSSIDLIKNNEHRSGPLKINKYDLFSDSLLALVTGGNVRRQFEEFVKDGIPEEEFADLYGFLENYYPDGRQKSEILRELNKRYLRLSHITLKEKTDYLVKYYDQVGLEGMVIVGEQINHGHEYLEFRKRMGDRLLQYLDGSALINALAIADYGTSMFSRDYKALFSTCEPGEDQRRRNSQRVAEEWCKINFGEGAQHRGVQYVPEQSKFALKAETRGAFRTVSDIMYSLSHLTPFQRLAIAHKALTESGGALSSDLNRTMTGDILTKSLELPQGFVGAAVKAACKMADAKIISFPAANMIGPMLFRSLDESAIDVDKLLDVPLDFFHDAPRVKDVIDEDTLSSILHSHTPDVIIFGANYRHQPNSRIAQEAKESDRQYRAIAQKLLSDIAIDSQAIKERPKFRLDSSQEGVIQGVEASGGLGVKCLQTARQVYKFSPDVSRRLAEAFDANRGLNKLLFWENLIKLLRNENELLEFFRENKLVSIDEYLGGGSLYTTYAARIQSSQDSDEERKVVFKMLNPNAEAFVDETYKLAKNTLDTVISDKKQTKEVKQQTELALTLVDLSKDWCKREINDLTFIEDDDTFRQTIEAYSKTEHEATIYAPERVFTSRNLKIEDQAHGQTVNHVLNDDTVDIETKRQLVINTSSFYLYQLKNSKFRNKDGSTYYLVQSDPHIGNFVADTGEDRVSIGVIDRGMYLHLTEKDVAIADELLSDNIDATKFLNLFIDRVLEANNITGRIDKTRISFVTKKAVMAEYARQRLEGNIDQLALIITLMGTLSGQKKSDNEKVKIPPELQLLIRNISAIRELTSQYGVPLAA